MPVLCYCINKSLLAKQGNKKTYNVSVVLSEKFYWLVAS